jgi:hypothetical protein
MDSSVATYHVSRDEAIETAHGTVKFADYTGKVGDHAVVDYTETAGKKVGEFFEHLD